MGFGPMILGSIPNIPERIWIYAISYLLYLSISSISKPRRESSPYIRLGWLLIDPTNMSVILNLITLKMYLSVWFSLIIIGILFRNAFNSRR
jgi:hypothetical protein